MKKTICILLALIIMTMCSVTAAAKEQGQINALEYGFNNSGTVLNDKIMAKYISNDADTPIYFPSGTYLFSQTISFPNECYVTLAANAEWKLSNNAVQDYFITLRRGFIGSGYTFNSYIKGGYINANNSAKNGIGLYKTRHVEFADFVLKNVLEKGIVTRTEERADGQSYIRNVLIENDFGIKGTIGVYDNANDTRCEMVEVVNFETAFYTVSGRFTQCNAWLRDSSLVENSVYAVIAGYHLLFDSPQVDTYRYGFKVMNPNHNVLVTNMLWITNSGVYRPELQAQFPRCIFYAGAPECSFQVTGLVIGNETNLDFSNIELPHSSFLNVRIPASVDGNTRFRYFRDDSSDTRELLSVAPGAQPLKYDKAYDFDTLLSPGIYETDLTKGSGGKNFPNISDSGVLEVTKSGVITLQKFMGTKYFAYRALINGSWQNWTVK